MIGPGSSKKRTKYAPFVIVLALILREVWLFVSHAKRCSLFTLNVFHVECDAC